MSEPAGKKASYDDLFSIPENTTGEIIDGELFVTPRPSRKHGYTASALDKKIGSPYQFGDSGGPGGWIIIVEPEISLGENIIVPDLGGWRKERFPVSEETNWISVPPDWACEVLSPGTVRLDKIKKMPLYAKHAVGHLWLIDPIAKSLDVYRLESGMWTVAGFYAEEDKVRAEPFEEVEIDLNDLWLEAMV